MPAGMVPPEPAAEFNALRAQAKSLPAEDEATREAVRAAIDYGFDTFIPSEVPDRLAGVLTDAALAAVWATPPPWLVALVRHHERYFCATGIAHCVACIGIPESVRLAAGIETT